LRPRCVLAIVPLAASGWRLIVLVRPAFRESMDAAEITAYIRDTFPGVETTEAYGYTFFFYGSERVLPFATMAMADNEHDRVSELDRDGAYRLNIGVSREAYRSLLGDEKPRLGAAGIIDGDHDFTLRDQILPHPHYAPQSWVCVVSPGKETFQVVRGLLREAYDRAVLRASRKDTSDSE
jgi:hypothetical protein